MARTVWWRKRAGLNTSPTQRDHINCWRLKVCPLVAALLFAISFMSGQAQADSSSPLLHAYYDRFIAIVDGKVFAWHEDKQPARISIKDAAQVGTDNSGYFILTKAGDLFRSDRVSSSPKIIAIGIAKFSSGKSGLLLIDTAATLRWRTEAGKSPQTLANNIVAAAVGDGANYFINRQGGLFVRGLAHRGQYGDGRLRSTKTFVQTARSVSQIKAHTGHAILLSHNGDVLGTGGNIYGPVGKHGLGDKAVRWSKIASRMKSIATGASHSFAIDHMNNLFAWGSDYGVQPKQIMKQVRAVAAGSRSSIALQMDGSLWQWRGAGQPQRLLTK